MATRETGISLDWASPDIRRILGDLLEGGELSVDDGIRLAETHGRDFQALTLVADEMRRRQAGDVVTYVVNRNINFTNVCIKHCTFCAFSRDHREEEGYFLPMDEVVRRAIEAWEMGATEVCIQAGLPPKLDGRYYIDLCRAIKAALPEMHLHAFSPEEILYGSTRSGLPIPEYLAELKQAGLGTLPGTSAEVLDQEIRDVIARGRITVKEWIEVITSAHALGIRTTSTIMYGHVEQPTHWIRHMDLLRRIQKDTGGFTEFVPLSLIHQEAPMYRRGLVPGVRQGATGRKRAFDRLAEHFLPGVYDPPAFTVRLAHKDMKLALELAEEAHVPMRVGKIALEELEAAMQRGWSDRDCRVAMTLQEERAGVSVKVPRERLENLPD